MRVMPGHMCAAPSHTCRLYICKLLITCLLCAFLGGIGLAIAARCIKECNAFLYH